MAEKSPTPRPRIEQLSDLVFGLALSIGAIALIGTMPKNVDQLNVAISAFGFSFLILINVWNRYTTITSVLKVETATMIRLNMLLLFLVSVEPYLFNQLYVSGTAGALGEAIVDYYAIDVACMNVVLAYFTHLVTIDERGLVPKEIAAKFRRSRNFFIIGALMFLVTVLPFFDVSVYGLELRFIVWLATFPVLLVARALGQSM